MTYNPFCSELRALYVMGDTRLIVTDATTAEAGSVLKSIGYYENSEGGSFVNKNSPLKIYCVWGKAAYYPDLLKGLAFSPRIQIHFKCAEETTILNETVYACAQGLLRLSKKTRIKIFNADTGEEMIPAALGD